MFSLPNRGIKCASFRLVYPLQITENIFLQASRFFEDISTNCHLNGNRNSSSLCGIDYKVLLDFLQDNPILDSPLKDITVVSSILGVPHETRSSHEDGLKY